MYGVDLTTLVKLEGGLVPNILAQCIKQVETSSIDSKGIYRVSGHNTEILELKEKYDHGTFWNIHRVIGNILYSLYYA